GHVEQADDVRPFHDRLPAEQQLHAFEQRADAAPSLVGDRAMTLEREGEFLVLGADAELRFRLDALSDPIDEVVAPFDRRQVDLTPRHGGSRREGAAPLHGGRAKEKSGCRCRFSVQGRRPSWAWAMSHAMISALPSIEPSRPERPT